MPSDNQDSRMVNHDANKMRSRRSILKNGGMIGSIALLGTGVSSADCMPIDSWASDWGGNALVKYIVKENAYYCEVTLEVRGVKGATTFWMDPEDPYNNPEYGYTIEAGQKLVKNIENWEEINVAWEGSDGKATFKSMRC